MTEEQIVDKDDEQNSKLGCIIVGLFLTLVAYVLSPPWIALMVGRLPLSMQPKATDILLVIYTPLQYLYDNMTAVQSFYDTYRRIVEGFL